MKKHYPIKTELPPLPEGYPISAKILLDSISEKGSRLTTFELVFPRYILAELNTHRKLSKNTSSSRAIPTFKQVEQVRNNPVEPVRYGLNQKGMSAKKENLSGENLARAREIWKSMADFVAKGCEELFKLELHKQWASRPLEPFTTSKVVVSTTEVDNLFMLRDHPDAQDEICYLIQGMKVAMNSSEPKLLKVGEWHTPYVSEEDIKVLSLGERLKVSSSRCARTSFKTHLGVTSTLQDDIEMFTKLAGNLTFDEENPFHASPTEHVATPGEEEWSKSNFDGWVQLRKVIEAGKFN